MRKTRQICGHGQRAEKTVKHGYDADIDCNQSPYNNLPEPGKETEWTGN